MDLLDWASDPFDRAVGVGTGEEHPDRAVRDPCRSWGSRSQIGE